MPKDPFIREKFTKLRTAARKLAAEYFERYPKDRYLTEVEGWRHLQSDNIEFTIKRLREPIDSDNHRGRQLAEGVTSHLGRTHSSSRSTPAIRT